MFPTSTTSCSAAAWSRSDSRPVPAGRRDPCSRGNLGGTTDTRPPRPGTSAPAGSWPRSTDRPGNSDTSCSAPVPVGQTTKTAMMQRVFRLFCRTHGRRKRGNAGDLTPQLFTWGYVYPP